MSIPPVEKSVSVPLPPDRAFDLFTARLDTWWPTQSHSVSAKSGKPSRSVTVGQEVGGTILETADDGSTHIWGTITVWEPAAEVAFTWHPGSSEDEATNVVVTFAPKGTGTEVRLVHTGWEVLEDRAKGVRDNYDSGWNPVMQHFVEAA